MQDTSPIDAVVIGRNEGARLVACLESLSGVVRRIIYVDSGSTDDSVSAAKALGAEVVELDTALPFTAARARNAGMARLNDDTALVQFIDGDCELAPQFPAAALNTLSTDADIGVVAGRCRELNPDATIYNRMCDMEWDGPIGEIEACGGIFLTRRDVFQRVDGFDPTVIAAEDDEFCIRVRASGARIFRIDEDMCFHDANMRRFGQWWRRSFRAGSAYAQLGDMHPGYFKAPRRRAWAWGLLLPASIIIAAPFTGGWSLALALLYPLSFARTRMNLIRDGAEPAHAGLYAGFLTLSKFPNLMGILDYRRKRLLGRNIAIVEYK